MILPPSEHATGFLCRLCDEKGLSRSRAPFDLGDQVPCGYGHIATGLPLL